MSRLIAVPITIREANAFVENFHRHNGPVQGARFAIGASDGEQLIGVAIVGRPVARMLQDGWTAEVLRTCTNKHAPKNTNSFLYGCSWRAWRGMGGRRLVTYTLATESGASLRGAGWRVVAESKPSEGWSRIGRLRRWQPIYGQLKLRWEVDGG